jgi:hypothetical protein
VCLIFYFELDFSFLISPLIYLEESIKQQSLPSAPIVPSIRAHNEFPSLTPGNNNNNINVQPIVVNSWKPVIKVEEKVCCCYLLSFIYLCLDDKRTT